MKVRILIALTLALCAFASPAQTVRTMPAEESARFEARLRGWAHKYYPAMTSANQLPEDIVFAFLVDRNGGVIDHTAGFKGSPGSTIPDELARFFPRRPVAQYERHGAACFPARGGEPQYCVYYATIRP